MSRVIVQCRGSGEVAPGHGHAKNPKSSCRWCNKRVEVTSGGRLRKHMHVLTEV